mmetsp:Transcript_31563/g.77813  ORF Transcript_31563/g.77813 Transcript_31563/m.77813 type:complete len:325 (+) Transcript_31563:442-1416(+)
MPPPHPRVSPAPSAVHSIAARDDVVGKAVERRRGLAVLLERVLGVVDQLLRHLLGALETQQLRVGGLVGIEVLARRLTQLLRRRGHVQDVVGDLEGEANLERVHLALLDLLVGRASKDGAARDCRLEQGGRLVRVDPGQRVHAHVRLALRLQVEHLSARQADRADRLPQRGDDLDDPIGGHVLRLARDVVEGLREQRVAGEDGDIVAVQLVVRRLAAPEVVVVHRRQVVVDQAHRVDHLERDRRWLRGLDRAAEHLGGGEAEHRAHALAARHQRVLHRLDDQLILLARCRERRVQRRLGDQPLLLHVSLEVEGGGDSMWRRAPL